MTPPKATRRHTTLALRIVALAAVSLLVVPVASGAEEAPESLSQLRSRRQGLIQDIAAATDRLAQAESAAADAAGKLAAQAGLSEQARQAVAHHAVAAFVDAAGSDAVVGLRTRSLSETLSEGDRGKLQLLRTQAQALESAREIAQQTAAEAQKDREAMAALRAELERTIADRVSSDAAAARARAAATASYDGSANPRATATTRNQSELMAKYTFGPVGGRPDGLVSTGTVIDGMASWYGPGFDGHTTASGAVFDQEGWTVASRTLPLGTMLLITRGDVHVLVLVNDRGPYVAGRVLDLSHGVADALGTVGAGVAMVHAEVVVPTG
jgi:rare lipoprotein A (peptidoglycan hydrolase)